MMTVGLTGGIGSGKSTVARMFQDLGVPVYDSDMEAKRLMNNSESLKTKIIGSLGKASYKNGTLNTHYVAKRVFNDPSLLEALNNLVHPAVKEDFVRWAENFEAPYVIQETALIFENGTQDWYNYVILITAPTDLRISRVTKRDGSVREDVMDRMKHQLDDDEKLPHAHFHIENLDLETTRQKVLKLHESLVVLSK